MSFKDDKGNQRRSTMSYGAMFAKPHDGEGVRYIDVQIPHCDVRVLQHDDADIRFYALNKEDKIDISRNGDTIEIRKAGSNQVVRSGIVANGNLNISGGSIVTGGDLTVTNGLRRSKPPRKLTLTLTLLVPRGVRAVYASAESVKIADV